MKGKIERFLGAHLGITTGRGHGSYASSDIEGSPAVPCCQLNISTPKSVPMYSPGRNIAVMTASAFMDELSLVEATAMRALRLLSSWAIFE